jgi:hypothetical protein
MFFKYRSNQRLIQNISVNAQCRLSVLLIQPRRGADWEWCDRVHPRRRHSHEGICVSQYENTSQYRLTLL